MRQGCIEEIVINYLKEKVTEVLRDEFVNAAIHFNINENVCTIYDSMRIEYMLNKIDSEEIMDYIELCSTYGYIIYRAVQNKEFEPDDRIEALQVVLEISNIITSYVTMRIDENQLYKKLNYSIEKLELSDDCNEKVLELIQ